MFHLEVVSGKHHEKISHGEIKHYKKGDVVESLQDLRKTFPNKFKLVREVAPKAIDEAQEFELKSLGQGRYDVLDKSTEKPVNEEPLNLSEAEKLINSQEEI